MPGCYKDMILKNSQYLLEIFAMSGPKKLSHILEVTKVVVLCVAHKNFTLPLFFSLERKIEEKIDFRCIFLSTRVGH